MEYSPLSSEILKYFSIMLIGELSKKTGLSRDTIRFYEKQGLIEVGRRDRRFNNYKEYSEETLQKLNSIIRIKGFGFTLSETSTFLQLMYKGNISCNNVTEKLLEKSRQIDEKINELQLLKAQMMDGINNCLENCCTTNSNNCQVFS